MAGNHANIEDTAKPVVEPAPQVGLVVRFNGCQQPVILDVDQPQTLNFGTFPIEVEVKQIIRKKLRPAKAPPYTYIIKTASGEHRIRSMDEINAARIFGQRNAEEILSIEPEIV